MRERRPFWDWVDKEVPGTTCWLWRGYISPKGYGMTAGKYAHRIAWELLRGTIPPDMQIDHLCRTRHCVNPDHMELVTCRVNLLRGNTVTAQRALATHCPKGHELKDPNVIYSKEGWRKCRTCDNDRQRDRYRRRYK